MQHWRYLLVVCLAASFFMMPHLSLAAEQRCFTETGYCIEGRFLSYWDQNGGLPVFGYPLTRPRMELSRDNGRAFWTQWFERGRFEYHPENAAPYDVLLGRLGADLRNSWELQPRDAGPQDGCLWFADTSLNVCNQADGIGFKQFWETHGLRDPRQSAYQQSLALFGLPLTTPQMEQSLTDGKTYLTQWFERARFEWHPNEPQPYKVLLGLLGSEIRSAQGSDPQASDAITYLAHNDVFITLPSNGQTCQITTKGQAGAPVWSPDHSQVAFLERDGLYIANMRELVSSSARQLICDAPIGPLAPADVEQSALTTTRPAWSPDGTQLTYAYQNDVFVVNVDGSGAKNLTNDGAGSFGPQWSPRGDLIAFVRNNDIYTVASSGGSLKHIVDNPAVDSEPTWSPDGSRLAFVSSRNGVTIYTVHSDGSNLAVAIPNNNQTLSSDPHWANTRQELLYTQYRSDIGKSDVITAYGEYLTEHYPNNFGEGVWSPDDRFVAFKLGAPNEDGEIYFINGRGGVAIKLADGQQPDW